MPNKQPYENAPQVNSQKYQQGGRYPPSLADELRRKVQQVNEICNENGILG